MLQILHVSTFVFSWIVLIYASLIKQHNLLVYIVAEPILGIIILFCGNGIQISFLLIGELVLISAVILYYDLMVVVCSVIVAAYLGIFFYHYTILQSIIK